MNVNVKFVTLLVYFLVQNSYYSSVIYVSNNYGKGYSSGIELKHKSSSDDIEKNEGTPVAPLTEMYKLHS